MDRASLLSTFYQTFAVQAEILARAPGRVNLLGEHVDYNDGAVLPVAIDRSVLIAARATRQDIVHLNALDLGKRASFSLSSVEKKEDLAGQPLPAWAHYPAGVAWSLQQAGYALRGLDLVYTSEVPIGAGLSSSAAVEVGFGMLWNSLCDLGISRLALAQLCKRAENDYVGLACGLMDQFASACGVAGHALYFDTRSLEWHPLPLPSGTAVVIADSGVRRSLKESAYNERRQSCEQAVELLRKYLPAIQSLRDVSPTEFAAYGYYLPEIVQRRAEHVIKEIARVNSAVNALQRQDAAAFGALMYAGHVSLRDLYQVSIPALDALVEIARRLSGCLGARLTGAGFGGCTVNLVEDDRVQMFIEDLKNAYHRQTGLQAQVYLCQASAGASAGWL
ncbi:MAG: galactokinase [Chloroflexi bacterium RBG_16_52_11]|nr:MAG: galactokinase [Chloroflexi bacterium RBG_16_52_11]